jgi:cytochrome c biogenesis protein CcmG/thiol:disulfide interchange protein DsbE
MIRHMFVALFLALSLSPVLATAADLDVAQYKGKIVYVDFWASWCVPCRKSFPWLNEMARTHKDDLVVVGINVDNERAAAMKFLEKYPAEFPLVFDPEGKLAAEYKLEGMPSAVILDRNGKVVHRHVGFREEKKAEYEKLILDIAGKH